MENGELDAAHLRPWIDLVDLGVVPGDDIADVSGQLPQFPVRCERGRDIDGHPERPAHEEIGTEMRHARPEDDRAPRCDDANRLDAECMPWERDDGDAGEDLSITALKSYPAFVEAPDQSDDVFDVVNRP